MPQPDVTAVVTAMFSAFARGDLDGMVDCLGEDFVWTLPTGHGDPQGQVVRGKAAARAVLAQRFFEDRAHAPVFSDTALEVAGELAILRFRVRAVGPDGAKVDTHGVELYRVTGGKIRSKEAYWKLVRWDPS